ncbi:MAG: DEAD/DEAH box helicase family protein [bacterium]
MTNYKQKAVDELMLKSKLLLGKDIDKRTIVFKAPTGSGKTFMMSQFVKDFIAENKKDKQNDFCFLWMSIGKGSLQIQSHDSLKKEFGFAVDCHLLENEFFGSRRTIDKNEVVVANWEKLRQKDKKTGEWKNNLMRDKETTNFRELVRNTREADIKIMLIIDESHAGGQSGRALELRDEIIQPYLTIEVSATPELKDEQEKVVVEPNDVINEGMIKKEIIINEDLDKIADDEIDSQEAVMQLALAKKMKIEKEFRAIGKDINPLVLVQLPNSEKGEDKRKFVEKWLAEKDITIDNGRLAVWLSEEKVNQEKEFLTKNNDKVDFLIFKQAIDTGWDCPRAHILVRFRETKSVTFEIQTIGRILRMPEAEHYNNDILNTAYIYTNLQKFNTDPGSYNKNIIKSLVSKRRNDIYGDLKLRSYYRNRIDFGDITMKFYDVLENTFCDYFDIKKDEFDNAKFFPQNKEKVGKMGILLQGLASDELFLNEKMDSAKLDIPQSFKINGENNFIMKYSEEDLEWAFDDLIRENLNGYAYKRSVGTVKMALWRWFKKALGLDPFKNNNAIYIQNICLNNYEKIGRLLDLAINNFKPVKEQEIKEKIKKIEKWDSEWEIKERRNFPKTDNYEEKNYKLNLYKPGFLKFDSEVEKEFVDFLEKSKDKILWWWQNGDEHMALNFGIKCDEKGKTFQPDFLVMFKNGKVGIYDTKASGFQEDDNKLKAEALQKYIKEENKRKKTDLLIGGLVIKEGGYFRINSDDKYESFKSETMVREEKASYNNVDHKTQKGWGYLEF